MQKENAILFLFPNESILGEAKDSANRREFTRSTTPIKLFSSIDLAVKKNLLTFAG
ncbi:MAG: hypothetical protein K6C10_09580 [Prevotella sp.]|nr:hypothetical protein [Prevotella sp.]